MLGGTNMHGVLGIRRGFVMLWRRTGLLTLALFMLVAAPGAANTAPDHGAKVYLLRGFMNVFSLGLDELAAKIEKRGIRAEVYNHTSWSRLAGEIAADYKSGKVRPVILVGHSLGGTAVIDLAGALGKAGVPVALAVSLDIPSAPVTGRVGTFLNLYVNSGALSKGPGFHGRLVNTDLSRDRAIGHFSIDKVDAVHALLLRQIMAAARPHKPPAQANAPAAPPS
jgi:pimeloyl-ACP methyl ester carboxylesterase